MATWLVQTGITQITEVEADAYTRDGDWIHFFDAEGNQVASYIAIGVSKKS